MKILFCDLDGTLVDKNNDSLSNRNIEMMHKLKEKGYLLALCTGRSLPELKNIEKHQFPFDYYVLTNGGHILDSNHNTLLEKSIKKEVAVDIIKYGASYKDMWVMMSDGHQTYIGKNNVTMNHGKSNEELDIPFVELYNQTDTFQVVAFNQDNMERDQIGDCYHYIQENYSDDVEAFYNLHFLDVSPKGCSKGTGIVNLLEMLPEHYESYGIGDSFNDLPMFEVVDHAYTFNQSVEEVKSAVEGCVDYVYNVIEDMLEEEEV